MADPFVAEIRIFPFDYAPRGWAFCQGQILPLMQNTALFSLLGVTYGGDGRTTFALPNLQSKVPLNAGQGPGLTERTLGETGGASSVTLELSQIPNHDHGLQPFTSDDASTDSPADAYVAKCDGYTLFVAGGNDTNTTPMSQGVLTPAGGSQPHNNMMPYLPLNFCIALSGIFPQRP